MTAGSLIFVFFVTMSLFLMSSSFSDLTPNGANPENLQQIAEPTPPLPHTDQCNIATLCLNMIIGPVINYVAAAWSASAGIGGILLSVFTFDIPAFNEMGIMGIMLRILLIIPMAVVMGIFLFFMIKSAIPTVGGNAE